MINLKPCFFYFPAKISIKKVFATLNNIHQVISSQKIISLMTMKSMEEKLSTNQFLRIHKSYLVNIHKVESLNEFWIIPYLAALVSLFSFSQNSELNLSLPLMT